ncbi:hypothetical protein DC363_01345 [Thalassorhabdomicrobium marinisediminis]|uniref:Uncharacterized protein n=2 Tax=Thalassorhabdomicrobium marinisediminis TaxID=2170577 RepID=A0A2T7G1A1_9RHOB|nr:hypothetical protein DC363_01345 [Thalassorhabdomicrobium marinisediminis]
MGFILGIVVVVVAILAWFMFAGSDAGDGVDDVNVTVEGASDPVESTGEAVEGSVEGATD